MKPKGVPDNYVEDDAGGWAHPSLVRPWTESEMHLLKQMCSDPSKSVCIESLAAQLHRTHASVALKISRMQLGCSTRPKTPEAVSNNADTIREYWASLSESQREERLKHLIPFSGSFKGHSHTEENKRKTGERIRNMIADNGHNKGMLGKVHSEATKTALSIALSGRKVPVERTIKGLKTKLERYGTIQTPRPVTWRQGWREIGGRRIYARSRWEANYARYLQFLKEHGQIAEWEHEPETFWFNKVKRGTVSYLPDFRVMLHLGPVEYHEVKGWMDSRSKTKLKRMKKYYPNIKIVLIDTSWFKANARKVSGFIKGWEQ